MHQQLLNVVIESPKSTLNFKHGHRLTLALYKLQLRANHIIQSCVVYVAKELHQLLCCPHATWWASLFLPRLTMNNRRKTLGGLSPAQVNARLSLGPARVAKDGTVSRKTLAGRPSIAGARGPANNAPSSRLGPAGPAPRRCNLVPQRA